MLKSKRSEGRERGRGRGAREGGKWGLGKKTTQFQVNDNHKRPEHRHDKTKQLSIPIFKTKETKT